MGSSSVHCQCSYDDCPSHLGVACSVGGSVPVEYLFPAIVHDSQANRSFIEWLCLTCVEEASRRTDCPPRPIRDEQMRVAVVDLFSLDGTPTAGRAS